MQKRLAVGDAWSKRREKLTVDADDLTHVCDDASASRNNNGLRLNRETRGKGERDRGAGGRD